jgi:hypothetical protein
VLHGLDKRPPDALANSLPPAAGRVAVWECTALNLVPNPMASIAVGKCRVLSEEKEFAPDKNKQKQKQTLNLPNCLRVARMRSSLEGVGV